MLKIVKTTSLVLISENLFVHVLNQEDKFSTGIEMITRILFDEVCCTSPVFLEIQQIRAANSYRDSGNLGMLSD